MSQFVAATDKKSFPSQHEKVKCCDMTSLIFLAPRRVKEWSCRKPVDERKAILQLWCWVLSEGPCLLFNRLQAAELDRSSPWRLLMSRQSRQCWEWQCNDLSEEGSFLLCMLTHFWMKWLDIQWKAMKSHALVKMTESGLTRQSPCFPQLLPIPHPRVYAEMSTADWVRRNLIIVWQELSPQVLWQGKARSAPWAQHRFALTSRNDKWKKAKNRWLHVSALPRRWQQQE